MERKRSMEKISSLFGGTKAAIEAKGETPMVSKRHTERGDLLVYFAKKTGKPIGYIAMRLKHMPELKDLYYLKSLCDQEEFRGTPWTKVFYGSIKPREGDEIEKTI